MKTRPENVEFVERAPMRISVEREIGASADRVFEVLADAPSWTKWWPKMRECDFTSEQRTGIGTTRRVNLNGLKVEERLVAWEPGKGWGFTWLSANPPMARAAVEMIELETVDRTKTKLHYTVALELRPPFSWMRGRIERQFREGIVEGLAGLDAHLISG